MDISVEIFINKPITRVIGISFFIFIKKAANLPLLVNASYL